MANYVQENDINIGYELWQKGYRINEDKFSESEFVRYLNLANSFDDGAEITFETMFQILVSVHPDWFINEVDEEERYRLENEPKLRKYFFDYFFGKTWNEIESDSELYERWGFYSDWHKDVFGYRPHDIVCGIYVNPHANVVGGGLDED